MWRAVTTAVICSLVLSACGGGIRDSNWNPGNWFGKSRSAPRTATTDKADSNPLIAEERDSIFRRKSDEELYEGTPITVVQSLVIEPTSGGAIIRATGVSLRQGAHDVRLNVENDGDPVDGVLTFTMEAVQPTDLPQGTQRSRTVQAARFISSQALADIRAIRVIGATNVQTSTRG